MSNSEIPAITHVTSRVLSSVCIIECGVSGATGFLVSVGEGDTLVS